MTDKAFERSGIVLTVTVVLFIAASIALNWLGVLAAIIIGAVLEIVVGGTLLHYWGKDYMSRTR